MGAELAKVNRMKNRRKETMKRILAVVLAICLLCALGACASKAPSASPSGAGATTSKPSESPAGDVSTEPAAEDVTINFFSNLTDRKNGQGFVEQTLIDSYMSENPNVKIVVEALDDEGYKTKFKAYASGSGMPDLVNAWGQPSFLSEVIDAGLLAELNPDDYKDYGFIEGSLAGFSKNGKLYGLARNTDIMGFYYNKKMFADNGWTVPQTYDDLIALGAKAKAAGLVACSMDGADKWPLSIYINDLTAKIGGDVKDKWKASIANGDFSDPMYGQAVELLQKAADAGLFQVGFETTDYGTSLNLFANGQAAMFYMGSWEMSMATNESVLPEVRENIGVFMMPAVSGGAGKSTDITAWNGGGYAVSAGSAVKEEAIQFLNYMFRPENWSRLTWENGICMSAQDYSAYLTGNETPVQKEFTDFLTGSSSITGVTFNDLGTSEFKTKSEDLSQEAAIKTVTPEGFAQALAAAAK